MTETEADTLVELRQAGEANVVKLQELASMGLQLDPAEIIKLRLDYVTEALVPEDRRAEFDLGWERMMDEVLESTLVLARQAKLTAGVEQVAGQLTLPGQ